jgi:hypothetical protein
MVALIKASQQETDRADRMGDDIMVMMNGLTVAHGIGIIAAVAIKMMWLLPPEEREDFMSDVSGCIRHTAEGNGLISPSN